MIKITEQWRVCKESAMYQVSNRGRVRSLHHGKPRILKPMVNKKGYRFVALHDSQGRRTKMVSNLVAVAFIPNPDGKPQVNHKDCNKANNRATNLEWMTNDENMQHSVIHEMRNNKLTHMQVTEIKQLKGTTTQQIIADRYGVSRVMVSHIFNGIRRTVLNTE